MKSIDDINLSRKRIMVVDDDEFITTLLGTQLPKLGFETVLFNDPRLGLLFFDVNHAKIDIALVDIKMPYLDGIRLVKKMRQAAPDVPVLFLSGILDTDNLDTEGIRVLHKPIWSYDLAREINNLIDCTR